MLHDGVVLAIHTPIASAAPPAEGLLLGVTVELRYTENLRQSALLRSSAASTLGEMGEISPQKGWKTIMRVVLLGAPGSGKGTQGKAVVEKYRVTDIATGDLLRAEVAAGTPLGLQVKTLMETGELVPDDIVVGMIKEHLAKDDTTNGFLLDGFPRDLPQAETLDAMLKNIGQPLDVVLFFKVDYGEIMKRLLARHRADDTEDTIRHRLEIYEAKTKPLIDYYKNKGLISEVNGIGEIADVSQRIFTILDDIAVARQARN